MTAPAPLFEQVADRRERLADAGVVCDYAVFERDVEVRAHEHPLPGDIDVADGLLVHRRLGHAGAWLGGDAAAVRLSIELRAAASVVAAFRLAAKNARKHLIGHARADLPGAEGEHVRVGVLARASGAPAACGTAHSALPGTLFAAMLTPTPLLQMTTPSSTRPSRPMLRDRLREIRVVDAIGPERADIDRPRGPAPLAVSIRCCLSSNPAWSAPNATLTGGRSSKPRYRSSQVYGRRYARSMAPSRRMRRLALLQSITVESRPRLVGPPSMAKAQASPTPAIAAAQVVGRGRPVAVRAGGREWAAECPHDIPHYRHVGDTHAHRAPARRGRGSPSRPARGR